MQCTISPRNGNMRGRSLVQLVELAQNRGHEQGDAEDLDHVAREERNHARPHDGGKAHALAEEGVQDQRHIRHADRVQHAVAQQTCRDDLLRLRLTPGDAPDHPRRGDQSDQEAARRLHEIPDAAALREDLHSRLSSRQKTTRGRVKIGPPVFNFKLLL